MLETIRYFKISQAKSHAGHVHWAAQVTPSVPRYQNLFMLWTPGGGPLECQGEYQARPKIHVIRVVFQDQALYAPTSFIGAKTCKNGKKGVFLVM